MSALPDIAVVRDYLTGLQDRICTAIETADGSAKFVEDAWTRNTPDVLRAALAPFRADGTLPDYPLGSDFTEVEQRLARALTWLKSNTGSTRGKLATVAAALVSAGADDQEAMARMALSSAHGAGEWLQMRLLRLALARTQPSAP